MPSIIDTPRISSMGEIFSLDDRQYRVPPYQRDYEWGEDQIDDFVEDLFRINHDEDEHFLGTIVISDNAPGPLHKGPDSIKYIIDEFINRFFEIIGKFYSINKFVFANTFKVFTPTRL